MVLSLISGGGSALLCQPLEGLSLEEKQGVTRALLDSGATIGEMNVIRQRLSQVKGGRLAAIAAPAKLVTLFISDVAGGRGGNCGLRADGRNPSACRER